MCGIKSEWWVRLVTLRVCGDGSPFVFRILCASVGGCWSGTDGVRVVVVQNKHKRPTSLDSISFACTVAEKIDDETGHCTPRQNAVRCESMPCEKRNARRQKPSLCKPYRSSIHPSLELKLIFEAALNSRTELGHNLIRQQIA